MNPLPFAMKPLLVCLAALFAAFASPVQALAAEPPPLPPPKFPLVLRAPERAAWTITRERKGGGEASGETKEPVVTQLSVSKTSPIYSARAVVVNGTGWEQWVVSARDNSVFRLIKYGNGSAWKRMTPGSDGDYAMDFTVSDFEEFEWVNKETYKGVEMLDEQPVYVFQTDTSKGPLTRKEAEFYDWGGHASAMENGQSYGPIYTVTAWIDPNTLLPIKLDRGTEIRTYTFQQAPASRLSPPGEVLEEIKRWLSEIKSMSR